MRRFTILLFLVLPLAAQHKPGSQLDHLPPNMSENAGLTVTRDGRSIAWMGLDHQDSDLMLIDNFR